MEEVDGKCENIELFKRLATSRLYFGDAQSLTTRRGDIEKSVVCTAECKRLRRDRAPSPLDDSIHAVAREKLLCQ